MAVEDKYSRPEEDGGFTQDFKEKEGDKPHVEMEDVGGTGWLTPAEALGQGSRRFHGKMKMGGGWGSWTRSDPGHGGFATGAAEGLKDCGHRAQSSKQEHRTPSPEDPVNL